ncbi:TPA: hypothetical protein ENS27_06355 [bacterium]|nr:hypothetical protein [bacterium]
MILPFIFWGTILFGFFLLFFLIFRRLQFNDMGIPFALSNLTIVLIITALIFTNRQEAQIEFFWFILIALDFPISLLYGFFKAFFLKTFGTSDINLSILSPLIFFALFGTVQYYVIGKLLGHILQKRKDDS